MQFLINIYQLLMLMLMLSAAYAGLLANFLFLLLAISTFYLVILKLIQAFRRKLTYIPGLPWGEARPLILLGLMRCLNWSLVGASISIAMIPIQFPEDQYHSTLLLIWSFVGAICFCSFFPMHHYSKFASASHAIFFFFLATVLGLAMFPIPLKGGITLSPPGIGKWYVFQGGGSPLVSHHYFAGSQRYALDLIKAADGQFAQNPNARLESSATFNQPILAPISGKVIGIENSLEDNAIGKTNPGNPAGNHVILETNEGVYILLAHLKKGSIGIKLGEQLEAGAQIGLCGNSGNSSQPHLHIQAMTKKDLFSADNKAIPMLFEVSKGSFRVLTRNDSLESLKH